MDVPALVRRSELLAETIDSVVESIEPTYRQALADSAWYRFCSVNVMVRDEGAGSVAASLARSLLEQAAYWDWALATGVGEQHIPMWAGLEFERLERLADSIDDRAWLGWLLPPGTEINTSHGLALPRNPTDAVKRLGHGLDQAVLAPLQFTGVVAAYRILGVLAHSNIVGALLLAEGRGRQLPDRLAAIVIHVAAAGAVAVVASLAPTDAETGRMVDAALSLAGGAAEIHQLPMTSTVRTRRPSKALTVKAAERRSSIHKGIPATQDVTDAGLAFLVAADRLTEVALANPFPANDGGAQIAIQSFLLGLSHLDVVRGTLDGRLGRALLPFAARPLFEDGARWEWLMANAAVNVAGDSLRALVRASLEQRERIRSELLSEGVPKPLAVDLLGIADQVPLPELGAATLPPIDELLSQTHRNASGVESARVIYSTLSQFVHATPLSILHLQRDKYPSLTAQTWAISVEAACRGFERLASVSLLLADLDQESLAVPLAELRQRTAEAVETCSIYHSLG